MVGWKSFIKILRKQRWTIPLVEKVLRVESWCMQTERYCVCIYIWYLATGDIDQVAVFIRESVFIYF